MGNMNLVTGYRGAAHVTADDHGSLYAGIFGEGNYVLDRGEKLAATAVSGNKINIADGDLIMQGRHGRIAPGAVVSVTIQNGSQGVKRHDLIVARYTRNASTSLEDLSLVVIKGTAVTGTPADPAYTAGDILNEQAETADFPLYRVVLNGINIEKIERIFELVSVPLLDEAGKLQTSTMPDSVPLLNEDGKLGSKLLDSEVFVVTVTNDVPNKTYNEIVEARDAGKLCLLYDKTGNRTAILHVVSAPSGYVRFMQVTSSNEAKAYTFTKETPNKVTIGYSYFPGLVTATLTKNSDGNYVSDKSATDIHALLEDGFPCVLVRGADIYNLTSSNGTTCMFERTRYVAGGEGDAVTAIIEQVLIGEASVVHIRQYRMSATVVWAQSTGTLPSQPL